jgi:arginase
MKNLILVNGQWQGGGCDADFASVAYMNVRYKGDLSVLWFDAHGDINSAPESESHLFFGMPARELLCPSVFNDYVTTPLKPEQIINIGGRDFDSTEKRFMEEKGILSVPASVVNKDPKFFSALPLKENIYIHLDLDVLDPGDFCATPLLVPGGVRKSALLSCVEELRKEHDVAGMGVYEYKAEETCDEFLQQIVKYAQNI